MMMLSQSNGEDGLTADRMSEADAPERRIVSRTGRNWVLFELVRFYSDVEIRRQMVTYMQIWSKASSRENHFPISLHPGRISASSQLR